MRLLRSRIAIFFLIAMLLPLFDLLLPREFQIVGSFKSIFIFAILAMGLHVLTGYTGLLNLGVAAFMALGAYCFSILTTPIYPFRLDFFSGLFFTGIFSALVGVILGLPTLRLRGDYLAIVTLGFGEIVQDSLKNLDIITKGTQGITVPYPSYFGFTLSSDERIGWYYFTLGFLALVTWLVSNLESSRIGRRWMAIREDELAAGCLGVNIVRGKLLAFTTCAVLCGIAGALLVSSFASSGEPNNYDFQVSIIALCIVIVGGIGSIEGVLGGALLMVGFNSIFLVKISDFLASHNIASTTNVFSSPNNYKYIIFGLALVLTMRLKPQGLFVKKEV